MKTLRKLLIAFALANNGGCGLLLDTAVGPPPQDGDAVVDGGAIADAGAPVDDAPRNDAPRNDGGHPYHGCRDVEDLYYGYGLDAEGCGLECPWTDPTPCSERQRLDCLSELQTAAGAADCAAWRTALEGPTCACSSSTDAGTSTDAGVPRDDGGESDGGRPPLIIDSTLACNDLIELWSDYDLSTWCLRDPECGRVNFGRGGYCDGWQVMECLSAIREAAATLNCGEVDRIKTSTLCTNACRPEITP